MRPRNIYHTIISLSQEPFHPSVGFIQVTLINWYRNCVRLDQTLSSLFGMRYQYASFEFPTESLGPKYVAK